MAPIVSLSLPVLLSPLPKCLLGIVNSNLRATEVSGGHKDSAVAVACVARPPRSPPVPAGGLPVSFFSEFGDPMFSSP